MAISLRSISLSKVDSMVEVSVLLSTTRKFFSASAPVVTCCEPVRWVCSYTAGNTYTDAGKKEASHRVLHSSQRESWNSTCNLSHLISNHSEELPVLIVCLRG